MLRLGLASASVWLAMLAIGIGLMSWASIPGTLLVLLAVAGVAANTWPYLAARKPFSWLTFYTNEGIEWSGWHRLERCLDMIQVRPVGTVGYQPLVLRFDLSNPPEFFEAYVHEEGKMEDGLAEPVAKEWIWRNDSSCLLVVLRPRISSPLVISVWFPGSQVEDVARKI